MQLSQILSIQSILEAGKSREKLAACIQAIRIRVIQDFFSEAAIHRYIEGIVGATEDDNDYIGECQICRQPLLSPPILEGRAICLSDDCLGGAVLAYSAYLEDAITRISL